MNVKEEELLRNQEYMYNLGSLSAEVFLLSKRLEMGREC